MSSMVGLWRLATMWGFPRDTLPTEVVTMSMYVTPVASSWTMQVAYTITTVGPINLSGHLGLGGSMGAGEGESLSRQTTTPLKPGGSVTFGLALGNSGDDVEADFSCMALQWWALLPPALRWQHHCLNSPWFRGFAQWGSLTGQDAAPLSSQGSCYGVPSSFLSPHATQGWYLALQPAHWLGLLEWLVPHQAPL